jgi:hypothetical protein
MARRIRLPDTKQRGTASLHTAAEWDQARIKTGGAIAAAGSAGTGAEVGGISVSRAS